MNKTVLPLVAAVALGYLLIIAGVLYYVPMPWNLLAALVIGLMALRFLFTIRTAARIGTRRPQQGLPK